MKKFVLFIFVMILCITNVNALNIGEMNKLVIEKGKSEKIDLSIDVTEEVTLVYFTMVYSSYDIPADFYANDGFTDKTPNDSTHKIVFSNPLSGNIKLGFINIRSVSNTSIKSGKITLYNAYALTKDGEKISLDSQVISVSIGTIVKMKEEKVKNLLKGIDSDIVNIELKDDVYEYSVQIDSDVEELDLKPVPKDEKYGFDISTQKISELDDNQIIISVKSDDVEEKYIINVDVKEKDNVVIDDSDFEVNYQYKNKWYCLIVVMTIMLFVGLILNRKK